MKINPSGAVTLVVDTNLFLECRPLSAIPWADLGFDEITLIVPRPVQQEIDNHKKGIKGRTFKKALATTTLFREIVVAGGQPLVVQEDAPRVTLSLMAQSKIDPTLAEDLDPDFNDDAIILRLLQYAQNNSSDDVRLLTHDTGPMATAQSVGVGFLAIPDEWLSNEHDDPATKENFKLQAELKRLKSQEPVFSVSVRDSDDATMKRLDVEIDHYEKLTFEEIDDLMAVLQEGSPLETEFGSAETTPQPSAFTNVGRITVTEFQPAKQNDIEEYRDVQYPEWLADCRSFFDNLHQTLNSRVAKPNLSFQVCNTGTRPATQSLVRFVAMGSIEIFPVSMPDEDEEQPTSKPLRLASPPTPPHGKWMRQSGIPVRAFDFMSGFGDPGGIMRHLEPRLNLAGLSPRFPEPRDPDSFYCKGGWPDIPQKLVELTCDNWRHNISPEVFDFEVHRVTMDDVSAALKFEVHAENLTDPVQVTVPITIKKAVKSTLEKAREFVEAVRPSPAKGRAKGLG